MIRVCGVLRAAGRCGAPWGAGGLLSLARTASTAGPSLPAKMFPKEEFASRHIGPRDYEQREMLDCLGFKVRRVL